MPSGYHLGCKTKSADQLPHCENLIGAGAGAGLAALARARAHIHDRFLLAAFAKQGEINKHSRRQHLDRRCAPASRTNNLVSL